MIHRNHFVIHNATEKTFSLFIEPEGVSFALQCDQTVTIRDDFFNVPVTLRIGSDSDGNSILSIWPGDGRVTVEKDGIDVLDMLRGAD